MYEDFYFRAPVKWWFQEKNSLQRILSIWSQGKDGASEQPLPWPHALNIVAEFTIIRQH